MDSPVLSLTSTTLIVVLLLLIIAFGCHYLRPRAASWLRVNKEEKIGLSKNKLFHANGYMIYTGSDFFLSSSGSFKRFDTVDKEDHSNTQTHKQQQPLATTSLWNLPQAECEIPPQPLRPAPAPLSASSTTTTHNKSVTFSFERIDYVDANGTVNSNANNVEACIVNEGNGQIKYTTKSYDMHTIPQPLSAPPHPRLSSPNYNANAIPRPTAKRHNGTNGQNGHNGYIASTNPFLSDATTMTANVYSQAPISILKSTTKTTTNNNGHNNENPFTSHITHTTTTQPISQATEERKRSISETNYEQNGYTHVTENLLPSKMKELCSFKIPTTTIANNPFTSLTQRVKGPHMLQKTISEDYLFRKLGLSNTTPGNVPTAAAANGSGGGGGTTWTMNRALRRQSSTLSLGIQHGHGIHAGSMTSIDGSILEHAISCDSVTSEADTLNWEQFDQAQTTQQVEFTGHLCVSVKYDKNTMTADGLEIEVTVIEARDIVCPFRVEQLDTFVRIFLVPDQATAMQTRVYPTSANPHYSESFNFWLSKEYRRHSLWFHLYHNGSAHTLIGEAELEIGDMPNTITTWLPLSDTRDSRNTQWGELMLSLSYLPTAERLTIVVVKARNLDLTLPAAAASEDGGDNAQQQQQQEIQNVFVKVYLMNNGEKILKKRTSVRRCDRCPVFNEAMIFSMPPSSLTTVQLRLTVFGTVNTSNGSVVKPLGHIIAGSCATGKGLRHWHQMLSSLRKPVAMWHVLRRATNQPIFIGGAEAVAAAMKSSSALSAKRNSIF